MLVKSSMFYFLMASRIRKLLVSRRRPLIQILTDPRMRIRKKYLRIRNTGMAVASFEDPESDRVWSSTHSVDRIHTLIALFELPSKGNLNTWNFQFE
jgi:hypothetical protein